MSPEVICLDCGKKKEHHGLGLCGACYVGQWCKNNPEGIKAINRRYHAVHREERNTRCRRYYHEHRDEMLAWARQYHQRNSQRLNAKARRWRKAHIEQQRQYREKNRTKIRAKNLARKALKRSLPNTLTGRQAEILLAIGQMIYPGEKLHLDHIVPLSRGGGTTRANMHAIPANLNMSKQDKLPEALYRQEDLPWLSR